MVPKRCTIVPTWFQVCPNITPNRFQHGLQMFPKWSHFQIVNNIVKQHPKWSQHGTHKMQKCLGIALKRSLHILKWSQNDWDYSKSRQNTSTLLKSNPNNYCKMIEHNRKQCRTNRNYFEVAKANILKWQKVIRPIHYLFITSLAV